MVAEDTEGLDERDMTSFLIEVRDLSQYGSVILTVDLYNSGLQSSLPIASLMKIILNFTRNPNWHIFLLL